MNEEIPAYVVAMRADHDGLAAQVAELEAQAEEIRRRRNLLASALRKLDPTFPRDSKPGPKAKATARPDTPARRIGMSEETQAAHLEKLKVGFNGNTFTAAQVAELLGIHPTSANKFLRRHHELGRIRLDHMGGPRHMTKFYAIAESAEQPGGEQ